MEEQKKIKGYDPNTGAPIYEEEVKPIIEETPASEPKKIKGYDPNTGAPIYEDNTPKYNPNTGAPIYNNNNINPTQNTFTQTFQDETNKRKETLCEVGFWFSIVGLIISFIGVSFGLLVYGFDFYCAAQGLKTRKRGKAIATIVLSAISILILIIEMILVLNNME